MDLMALADKLEAEGLGVKAESIFLNMMPAECELGILLRAPLSGVPINWELTGYYKSSVRLIVRAHNYTEGNTLMTRALESLTILSDTQIGSMWIRYLRSSHTPASFPLSKGNFIEFSVNMDICYNEGA